LLEPTIAILAVTAGISKDANTDKIADLVKTVGASLNNGTDYLVTSDAGAWKRAPSSSDGGDVKSTDATVSDFDLDVLRSKRAGVVGKLLQGERSIGGPAGEGGSGVFNFGIAGGHGCF